MFAIGRVSTVFGNAFFLNEEEELTSLTLLVLILRIVLNPSKKEVDRKRNKRQSDEGVC